MKLLINLFALLMLTTALSAQNTNQHMNYKKYAGRYGNSSGVCLFDDGKFLLYGYATSVFGSYNVENNQLLFYPDQQELFNVFAHQNKSIGNNTRINFVGFERTGKTYIRFDKENTYKIFNDGANCFNSPFVYERAKTPASFALLALIEDSRDKSKTNNLWHYTNENGYNDFILVYNAPKREYENFIGIVSAGADGEVLKLSNYGGDKGYGKQKKNKDEEKQMSEILEWKNQYDQSKGAQENIIFANKHYNIFPEPDTLNYQYNQTLNQYVSIHDKENESYYQQNQYKDNLYLSKYLKLQPQTKEHINSIKSNIAIESIFFSTCGEGSEKSYHYNGFEKHKAENMPMPVKMEPVKIMPDHKKGNK
ncbi:preprotein translocase subunit SecD [Pedobacter nototheniae]|uniref:preprotein translocase subunit SecD n=1 Tax=Pedobacter nototheniae TaxID=2488994 RepID=UPI0029302A74|nr:preprotein translocase subunit SecD [Pedobacter nototheniae]